MPAVVIYPILCYVPFLLSKNVIYDTEGRRKEKLMLINHVSLCPPTPCVAESVHATVDL